MNGRLIIELPTSLSASIITEWLSVKDRVRLDSAHCQASVREEFLQLNRIPELSVKSWVHDEIHAMNRALVIWAMTREVFVEKLVVETQCYLDLYNVYLQKFASRVLFLRLNCSNIARLAQSIGTCCNLLVLKIYNWKLSATLRDVFVCCKRLREFCGHSGISPNYSESPLAISHLESIVCNNVKYLELTNHDVGLVAAFLRMAVAVEVVVLTIRDVPLDSIPESVSLTTTTLSLNESFLDSDLADFVPRGEQLENLCFRSCSVLDSAITTLSKFPNVRALDMTCAHFRTLDYLSVLASSCGDKLTELLLFGCDPSLSPFTVQEVLPLFTRLESFSLHLDCYNSAVWNMTSLSRLVKLSIYCESTKNTELVSQLTEHCHENIQELSLCMMSMVSSDLAAEQLNILVSKCTKLRRLNIQGSYTYPQWCTEEEKERWKSLRPGLVVGDDCEYLLNVFGKYESAGAW